MRTTVFLITLIYLSSSCSSSKKEHQRSYPIATIKSTFQTLFDGSNASLLKHWQKQTGYKIINNSLTGNDNLYTKKKYSDFILYSEFKFVKKKANSGYGIRMPEKGNAAYNSFELQILDNPSYGNSLKDFQYHGSVYSVVPAKPDALKEFGQWNKQIIIIKGTHLKIILNRKVILDVDLSKQKVVTFGKNNKPFAQGLSRTNGIIGIMGHGSGVHFKNIYIKEIK